MKGGYIYIMSNATRTTLYIGVTSNLQSRVYENRHEKGSLFTSKYKLDYLVYYEYYSTITEAIDREKQLKVWRRSWKDELIRSKNPAFLDLTKEIEGFR